MSSWSTIPSSIWTGRFVMSNLRSVPILDVMWTFVARSRRFAIFCNTYPRSENFRTLLVWFEDHSHSPRISDFPLQYARLIVWPEKPSRGGEEMLPIELL